MEGIGVGREGMARLVRALLDDPVWEKLRKGHPEETVRALRSSLEESYGGGAPARKPRATTAPEKETMRGAFRLYTDGASSGNPGPSGAGGVIYDEKGRRVDGYSLPLGVTTNNVAEYTALREGLDRLIGLGARRAEIFLDSELVVRQIEGRYRVKSPQLAPLLRQVKERLAKIPLHRVRHVPREENGEADRLARDGIDRSR